MGARGSQQRVRRYETWPDACVRMCVSRMVTVRVWARGFHPPGRVKWKGEIAHIGEGKLASQNIPPMISFFLHDPYAPKQPGSNEPGACVR